MTSRSLVIMFLLTCVTGGIYLFYWMLVTAAEMNRSGANIPHWILALLPLANLYYLWQWAGGVAYVTQGERSQAMSFALSLLLPGIGMVITQAAFNRLAVGGHLTPAQA